MMNQLTERNRAQEFQRSMGSGFGGPRLGGTGTGTGTGNKPGEPGTGTGGKTRR
jgi:hypothetical protein